jgi:beta-aspartyl-peptidase (threonine type)
LEKEIVIKNGILEALKAGYDVLKRAQIYGNDLSSQAHLLAVEMANIKLENNPQFNAGKGGKLNRNMEVEMDASIMNGVDLSCGGVAASKRIKNPIKGARLVMEKTPHVLLVGDAVDIFANEEGLDIERNDYFIIPSRVDEYNEAKEIEDKSNLSKKGTVGVVVRDHNGNLCAGTSTGGITYKMAGRVGDSPIIGAGNYANNLSCAVSCTGTGEILMKNCVAFDIHARMTYKNITLEKSLAEVFNSLEHDTGGVIAIDKDGNIQMPYNTGGMARGYVREDGKAYVYIFEEGKDLTPCEYDISGDEVRIFYE